MVDNENIDGLTDENQLISNGDFESGRVGWSGLSNDFDLLSEGSKSGLIHARMTGRTDVDDGFQQVIDLAKVDGSGFIEVSFWAKLETENGDNEARQGKIRI